MKSICTLFLLCFLSTTIITAQTTNLGAPKSWSIKQNHTTIDYHLMPTFDLNRVQQEDAANLANGIKTWRFGYEHRVNFTLQNSGTWTTLSNGDRLWQIVLESKGAMTMNVVFEHFEIPQGATLYLHNPRNKTYLGAYTHSNITADKMLGTNLIAGDYAIIEYYEPAAVAGQGILETGLVVHGYRNLNTHPAAPAKVLNASGPCNIDVNCPLGLSWQDQINSVAITIVGGSSACTGALINNTRNDGTPYFLTANHCGTNNAGAWVFRFNWDSPVAICATNGNSVDPGPPYNDVNGAVLRANSANSDFALFELNSRPTGQVYYAGWDRTTRIPTEATGIHHPAGDVKKICLDTNLLTTSTLGGAQCWQVADWDFGVTEGGSSGSPLFNQNKLIVGQLYGGTAACNGTTDNGQDDNYGRMDVSWDGTAASNRLRDWLDPVNTGDTVLQGFNPNGPGIALDGGISMVTGIEPTYCNVDSFAPKVVIRNYGSDTITSLQLLYNIDGASNSTYSWVGSLPPNTIDTVLLPTLTSTAGIHTFNVSTTLPNNGVDSNTINDSGSATFNIVLNGELVNYRLITDCFGSETTWELSDSNNTNVLYSGGPYSSNFQSIDTFRTSFCLAAGCYRYTIYDSFGDGLDGTGAAFCRRFGDYQITEALNGYTLVEMTAPNGNFGRVATHYFCVPYVINSQSDLDKTITQFRVYPNPTTGDLYINLHIQQDIKATLALYSTTGQLLQQKSNLTTTNFMLDMQDYPVGMYYVRLQIGDKITTQKVVKQ